MTIGRLAIDDEVAARFPDYAAIVLYARGLENGPSTDATARALDQAARDATGELQGAAASEHPHVAAWRRAFRSFGAKPSRYPSSVEALLKRIAKRAPPPRINRLVDAYNAVSLRHVLPAGGEDLDRLVGDARLRIADGSERFIILGEGEQRIEHPEPGEVVWIDDQDVTCRRWSWRQCRRTQLTEASRSAYFLLERLAPHDPARLERAADELAEALREQCPDAELAHERIGPGWTA